MPIVVEATSLLGLAAPPLARAFGDPIRRGARHNGEPAVAPELTCRSKAVRRHHDGDDVRRTHNAYARRGREPTHDRDSAALLLQAPLGLGCALDQRVELLTKQSRSRA